MSIKRVITDVLSVGVVISYLELKHIHYFSEQSEINNSIGSVLILLLILPVISLTIRVIDKVNEKANSNPVMIRLESNRYDLTWGLHESQTVTSVVPLKELIGNNPEILRETLRNMLFEASKNLPRLTPAPLIIVNSMVDLTKTEKEKLHHIVDEIGGVKVIVAVGNQQTKEALMSATLPNLIK
ncbi:TPA: hypothetical protein ACX6MF_001791 [Photobacterium damselae]